MGQTPVDPEAAEPAAPAVSAHVTSLTMQGEEMGNVQAEEAGKWFGSEPPPPDDDRIVGQVLSNTYQVLRVLGEGGMGRVYEAQHTRITSKRFAIKALHPEFAKRKDVLTRFHREVEAAASIASPHVVGVYDVDQTDDGRPFFVSELLTGKELGDYLDEHGRIAVAFAVKIVRQVCRALIAAHGRGVIHRDMKPENIFLSGDVHDPVVKVLDFGISRLEGQAGNTLTKTGVVMGTPSYMAPEQAKGLRVDHRADVYSVGAILYRAVTGRIPFDRADATATLAAVLTEEPQAPRSVAPDIPEHLELIIQKAMAREAEERYQSMEELDDALSPYDETEMVVESSAASRRPTQGSMTDAARAAREVSDARPQLFILGGIALFGSIAALFGIIAGAVRLARGGGALTGTEALVVALVLAAALSTPLALLVRHVRRATWGNIARVVELVRKLREPLLAAMTTYGGMALLIRTGEGLFVRSAVGAAWPAWDLLLPLAAVGAGIATWLGRRAEPGQPSMFDRLSPAASMSILVSTVLLVVLIALFARGDDVKRDVLAAAEAAEAAREEDEAGNDEASGSRSANEEGEDDDPPMSTADAREAWKEARIALQRGNYKGAVNGVEELFEHDPNAAKDKNVRSGLITISVRACLQDGALCDDMMDLLTEDGGSAGVDILYELVTTKGGTNANERAKRLLDDDDVLEKGSRGMQIAYSIRSADGCEEKKEYFDEAREEGDHRTLRELEILKSRRQCRSVGCCLGQDEDLKETIRAILDRRG